MNRITSIEPQDEDPNLRIVFVNGKYVATLTSNAISILNLKIGSEWNSTISSAVSQDAENEHGRKIAIKLISKNYHPNHSKLIFMQMAVYQ